MGLLIGRVTAVSRSQVGTVPVYTVRVKVGGPEEVTGDLVQSSALELPPAIGDIAVLSPVPGSGRYVVQATGDPDAELTADQSEARLTVRSGAAVYLRDDGSIRLSNGAGSITLTAEGDVEVSGTLEAASVRDTTLDVTLGTHLHPDSGGPPNGGT